MHNRSLCTFLPVLVALILCISIPASCDDSPWGGSFTWKACWGARDPEASCAKASEIGINAIIVWNSNIPYLQKLAAAGKKYGVETYFAFNSNWDKSSPVDLKQVMSPAEQARYVELSKLKSPELARISYQWGGEPVVPGEVFTTDMLCFHRPEVLARKKAVIKDVLTNVPDLTGIALDCFGYQNYRCCYCDYSMKLFKEYRAKHKGLSEKEAMDKFSRDQLVRFANDLTGYARSIRPGIKTTCHVYPVFLPEPLYGNRLDMDYSGETGAWFFTPFWPISKVGAYAKTMVVNQGKYFPNEKAVPLVGIYSKARSDREGYGCWKGTDRIKAELRAINQAGCDKVMFCCFDMLSDEDVSNCLKEIFRGPSPAKASD